MKTILQALAAGAIVVLGLAGPAMAQDQCGPYDQLVATLSSEYDEVVIVRAFTTNGAILEIFAAPAGKTWTILAISPDEPNWACLAAAGADWQPLIDPATLGEEF